jgi:DNA repair protein RecO (recombination protein O)
MGIPTRVDLEPAYVLHARLYRESSQLLEVFTAQHGRVGIIARGARRPKSAFRGLLDPFQPLRMSWSGRGELTTLTHAEAGGVLNALTGQSVMAGFYANELLLKLLERRDPHPDLFLHYGSLIQSLGSRAGLEESLRCFELQLLEELGYGLNLATEAGSDAALAAEHLYEFDPAAGVTRSAAAGDESSAVYPGHVLLAIGRMEFEDGVVLRAAKRLLRTALNFHLGERGLQTRRVAAAMKRPE